MTVDATKNAPLSTAPTASENLSDIEHRLTVGLRSFDWDGVTSICDALIKKLATDEQPIPEDAARRIMRELRRKCRFADMGRVGEALLQSGLQTLQVRRQYAQALIDQGMLTAAKLVLMSLIQDSATNRSEIAEAHGLLGRIYKQLFVDSLKEKGQVSPQAAGNLQRAFDSYFAVYQSNQDEYTWQGINAVALLALAKKRRISLQGEVDYASLATKISQGLAEKDADSPNGLDAFNIATQMEAFVALENNAEAYRTARIYADAQDTDAFELGSTLRQLQEVWGLDNQEEPGSVIIPLLRAARLAKEGGGITIPLDEAKQDLAKAPTLERVFGVDKSQSLKWYQQGLERAKAVCRIELADGKGFGTGWLVRSTDFFPTPPMRQLVVTNAHVISTTWPNAVTPPNVWANFQLTGKVLQIKSIVWSSPVEELDATFVDLVEDLQADPLPLCPTAMQTAEPGPRMYIIGHPGGRDLEFSLNDNRLVACNAEKLHYRTPTEGGSSGSPVFDPVGWQVVGLHHAGKAKMQKLGGPPGEFYEANEGIAALAIQQKTAQ